MAKQIEFYDENRDIKVFDSTEFKGTEPAVIEITENGTYDVTEYDRADVSVSGGGEDFTTATVTIETASTPVKIATAIVITDGQYTGINAGGYIPNNDTASLLVPLYKGKAYLTLLDEYSAPTTSGAVSYDSDDMSLIITGDGTATFTD